MASVYLEAVQPLVLPSQAFLTSPLPFLYYFSLLLPLVC